MDKYKILDALIYSGPTKCISIMIPLQLDKHTMFYKTKRHQPSLVSPKHHDLSNLLSCCLSRRTQQLIYTCDWYKQHWYEYVNCTHQGYIMAYKFGQICFGLCGIDLLSLTLLHKSCHTYFIHLYFTSQKVRLLGKSHTDLVCFMINMDTTQYKNTTDVQYIHICAN